MTVIYILLGIIAASVIAYGVYNVLRAESLDEMQEDLDKYSVYLDERANKLAAEEATLQNMFKELRDEMKKQQAVKGKIPCNERTRQLIGYAEHSVGHKLEDSRKYENVIIRNFVAYQLRLEGYSYGEIGKAMGVNHSTVVHYYKKMMDILSLPNVFNSEIRLYNSFVDQVNENPNQF